MRNLCFFLLFCSWMPLWGQIEEPVTWSFNQQPLDEGTSRLFVQATIDEGWHLYSQFMDAGGPIPTSLHFEPSDGYELIGQAEEKGEKESGYDELFEMDVAYFSNEVSFEQEVQLKAPSVTITGYVEFMVCDDEKCLPPDQVPFEFTLTQTDQKEEENTAQSKDSNAKEKESTNKEQKDHQEKNKENKKKQEEKEQQEDIDLNLGANEATPSNDKDGMENLFAPPANQILNPVEWVYATERENEHQVAVHVKAKIAPSWKIYGLALEGLGPIPTSIEFEEGPYKLAGKITERIEPIVKYDKFFEKEVPYFIEQAHFIQFIQISDAELEAQEKPEKLTGTLTYMACDPSRCLPPEQLSFAIELRLDGKEYPIGDHSLKEQNGELSISNNSLLITDFNLENPLSDCGEKELIQQSDFQFWQIFFLGFLGGFIALLTPCVFPMIPLTVSFFTNKGQDKKKGLRNAWLYGGAIFAIYVLFSLPFHFMEAVSPEIFNTISTSVWLNLIFFIVFVAFALSFFGFFEITIPASLTNKAHAASSAGSILGIFFMALTLALVSFSCTGPILGTLLASAGSLTSSSSSALYLSAGMAGFGLALALPFGLFAAFPQFLDALPRSGNWMTTLKVILGFVELALAIKFLSNADLVAHWGLLKREIFIGLWLVIAIGLALYLFGIIRFPHDTSIKKLPISRIVGGLAVSAFAVYLIPGLLPSKGANLSLLSGFPPPIFYSIYEKENECPLGLPCFKDYEAGISYAAKENKPVMLDFTGWACVNCRKMEENVWSQPEIYQRLSEDYVIISLYVDDRKELPEEEQQTVTLPNGRKKLIRTVGNQWATFQTQNFLNNSQPFYALMSPQGESLLNYPVGYTPEATEFRHFLDCGLETHNQLADGGSIKP